ncbi:alpha/beta fold hydrolase, partial [Pseudomonas agarici]
MRNESIRYLIVPGWQGSPEDHWQTHWQNSLPNSARVEQADWLTPRREDWVAALAEAVAADHTAVILIAHSLGCIAVAHWARSAPLHLLRRVRGALLVAPADVERHACAAALRNFAPI